MTLCKNCEDTYSEDEMHWYNINGECSDNDYYLLQNPDSCFIRLCDECKESIDFFISKLGITFEKYVSYYLRISRMANDGRISI